MVVAVVEISQTLDRGLRLLEVLSGSSEGLTVAEASSVLGVNRTIVYRLLATLEQHGLVRRVAGGRFSVGFGVLTLAGSVQPSLRQVAQPVLRALAEDVGATAHLTIADGAEALAVAVVEPTRTDYHVAYRVGSRHPLERGAAGRAVLAGREGSRDFVSTTGELQTGASGIAAPVLGVPGVEASVGVIALGALPDATVGPRVVAAAAQLRARLG
ncbi:IclR family transcriptional regulator [Jiangella alkaliphila]|uniref:DNA-binding transcriptional regulator, IclR family n=1 Tax=Jiangella alkaliphila TaxID=419479 RepID=A0A1H2LSX8_9ACTN|nr:DNA-binding transcriptional regulator, IclR family [Jiangella alkaliphila]